MQCSKIYFVSMVTTNWCLNQRTSVHIQCMANLVHQLYTHKFTLIFSLLKILVCAELLQTRWPGQWLILSNATLQKWSWSTIPTARLRRSTSASPSHELQPLKIHLWRGNDQGLILVLMTIQLMWKVTPSLTRQTCSTKFHIAPLARSPKFQKKKKKNQQTKMSSHRKSSVWTWQK